MSLPYGKLREKGLSLIPFFSSVPRPPNPFPSPIPSPPFHLSPHPTICPLRVWDNHNYSYSPPRDCARHGTQWAWGPHNGMAMRKFLKATYCWTTIQSMLRATGDEPHTDIHEVIRQRFCQTSAWNVSVVRHKRCAGDALVLHWAPNEAVFPG